MQMQCALESHLVDSTARIRVCQTGEFVPINFLGKIILRRLSHCC
jgi:hypothetical protein